MRFLNLLAYFEICKASVHAGYNSHVSRYEVSVNENLLSAICWAIHTVYV
jgi:hypothetical protein